MPSRESPGSDVGAYQLLTEHVVPQEQPTGRSNSGLGMSPRAEARSLTYAWATRPERLRLLPAQKLEIGLDRRV